jgi:hypothetical protein
MSSQLSGRISAIMPRNFEVTTDMLEATRSGIWGGPADECVVMVPGMKHYLIDGVEVSREVFERELRIDRPELAHLLPTTP